MWTVATVLAALGGLLAAPAPAQAQRPRLNLQAGPHSQHASTEHGSPTFRFQVAASGNLQELKRFCGDNTAATVGSRCAGNQNSHNTVKLEFDVKWQSFDEYGRQRYSGYPVHTKTALGSQSAVNNSNMKVGESPWVWDRTVNGVPRDDQRPLLATVTMTVIDTTKARAGSTTTHQLVLNPGSTQLHEPISELGNIAPKALFRYVGDQGEPGSNGAAPGIAMLALAFASADPGRDRLPAHRSDGQGAEANRDAGARAQAVRRWRWR